MIHADGRDVLARMATVQATLSPKMAQLTAFVGDHYVQVAFMTTRELAAAAGVSLATVVRFPTVLGYRNFDALRAGIQDRVNLDLTGVARLQRAATADRAPAALLRRVIDADRESLQALAYTFSEPQFERFASLLLAADRVTILATRYAAPLATYFEYGLAKLRDDVHAATQADSSLYDRVSRMGEGDLLVVIAFARYPADLVALVRFAAGRGVRVVAITDSPLSPVLPLAEVALFAKVSEVGLLDFVGSLAAPAALINCIVSALAVRLGEAGLARLRDLENAAAEAGVYAAVGGRPAPRDAALPFPTERASGRPATTRRMAP